MPRAEKRSLKERNASMKTALIKPAVNQSSVIPPAEHSLQKIKQVEAKILELKEKTLKLKTSIFHIKISTSDQEPRILFPHSTIYDLKSRVLDLNEIIEETGTGLTEALNESEAKDKRIKDLELQLEIEGARRKQGDEARKELQRVRNQWARMTYLLGPQVKKEK